MRIFAQKSKANQHVAPANAPKAGRVCVTQSRDLNSMLYLQRRMGNQAIRRLIQNDAEERNDTSANAAPIHFGRAFSQVSVRASNAGAIQPKSAIGGTAGQYEYEADRVSKQVMRIPEEAPIDQQTAPLSQATGPAQAPTVPTCSPTGMVRSQFLAEARRLDPSGNYELRTGGSNPPLGLTIMSGSFTLPQISLVSASRGRIRVEQTTWNFPSITSIYTTGRFREGSIPLPDPSCSSPTHDGRLPLNWNVSRAEAAISTGEQEHCADYICMARVIAAIADDINTGLAGNRTFPNEAAVEHARIRRGIPANDEIVTLFHSMANATRQRDALGWHSGPAPSASLNRLGRRCDVEIRLGAGWVSGLGRSPAPAPFRGIVPPRYLGMCGGSSAP